MDKAGKVLFVGCRNQKMIVMSAADGQVLAELPIGVGNDATAFVGGKAFASCRDGTLTVVSKVDGKYVVEQTVKTAPGAHHQRQRRRDDALPADGADGSGGKG